MNDLDYTYDDTWNRRNKNMQHDSYSEYLKSDWWKFIKEKASKRKCYSKCQFCKSKNNIHLHHTSYKWIYTKDELRAIISLCSNCHSEVHKYAHDNLVSVRIATNILRNKYKHI